MCRLISPQFGWIWWKTFWGPLIWFPGWLVCWSFQRVSTLSPLLIAWTSQCGYFLPGQSVNCTGLLCGTPFRVQYRLSSTHCPEEILLLCRTLEPCLLMSTQCDHIYFLVPPLSWCSWVFSMDSFVLTIHKFLFVSSGTLTGVFSHWLAPVWVPWVSFVSSISLQAALCYLFTHLLAGLLRLFPGFYRLLHTGDQWGDKVGVRPAIQQTPTRDQNANSGCSGNILQGSGSAINEPREFKHTNNGGFQPDVL